MEFPQFIAGRFRIEREIGRGGMGTVYRATHLGLHRAVAVKIIKAEYVNDPDVADRFMREARTMAKLRHPHAAIIFDAGSLPDGRHFIVMEYIEGVTLSDALAREHKFSPERAVNVAIQVCDVLAEAHKLGIIHRDLKPANIMLNERGICVLDFGVAKVLASSADSIASQASTGSGQVIGTPRYMSPEQCLGYKVGARSDLYSLGVVLYEMLAGRPPFVDPLPSVVMVKQATAAAPPLPHLRPDVPRGLALAVHSLLAKRPEDRPLTAADARSLLERSITRTTPAIDRPIEPLPSAVAAATPGRGLLFRVAAPLILVSIMGALLLALGYGGPAAETAASTEPALSDLAKRSTAMAVPALNNSASGTDRPDPVGGTVKPRPASLSTEQARTIASARTEDVISDVVVTQTPRGVAIVGIQNINPKGQKNFFVMERRGSSFGLTDKGPLDSPAFAARKWIAEKVNANDKGTQVLFSAVNATKTPALKLVLYDPQIRRCYSLTIETDGRTGQTRRVQWSNNAPDSRVAAYRVFLRDRARAMLTKTSSPAR